MLASRPTPCIFSGKKKGENNRTAFNNTRHVTVVDLTNNVPQRSKFLVATLESTIFFCFFSLTIILLFFLQAASLPHDWSAVTIRPPIFLTLTLIYKLYLFILFYFQNIVSTQSTLYTRAHTHSYRHGKKILRNELLPLVYLIHTGTR